MNIRCGPRSGSTRPSCPTTCSCGSRRGRPPADKWMAPYRFAPPVSPPLGAELAGKPIDPDRLRGAALEATEGADLLICEGVGGFMVTLTTDYLVRDLARDLGMPVTIVASPGIGTINHTLLTIEAVRGAGLQVGRVVLNPWPEAPSLLEVSNRETIAELGSVRVEMLFHLDLTSPERWPALGLSEPERRLRAA